MIEPHRNTFAMGCLFLALLPIGMYLIATPSRSQEAPAGPPCGPVHDVLEKLQKQFGETVTAGGIVGQEFMEILTNSRTGSFTILMRRLDGTACLVAGGEGFALADPAKMKGPGL